VAFADGAPRRVGGRMAASSTPGLGVTPKMKLLGAPVIDISRPGGRRTGARA